MLAAVSCCDTSPSQSRKSTTFEHKTHLIGPILFSSSWTSPSDPYGQLDPLLVLASCQWIMCGAGKYRASNAQHFFWLILPDKAVLSALSLWADPNPIEMVLFYKPYVNSTCLWKVTPSPPPLLVLSMRKHYVGVWVFLKYTAQIK